MPERSLIEQKILRVAEAFSLNPGRALENAKHLKPLDSFVPSHILSWVNYYAIPSTSALARVHFSEAIGSIDQHVQAVQLMLKKIAGARMLHNQIPDLSGLHVGVKTVGAMHRIVDEQESDILIVAAQLGMYHQYYDHNFVAFAQKSFAPNEFGLTSLAVGSILLSAYPQEFLMTEGRQNMNCPGDEFYGDYTGYSSPYFYFVGDKVWFGKTENRSDQDRVRPDGTGDIKCFGLRCAVASGFIPPF